MSMKINNIGEYQYIALFLMLRREGGHSICEVEAEYGESEIKKAEALAGKTVEVCLDKNASFYGYIDELTVRKKLTGGTVRFKILSHSAKADKTGCSYIFQSDGCGIGEITKKLDPASLTVRYASTEVQNTKMPEAVVNDCETDFEFVRQLAERHNISLWINDQSRDGRQLWLGDNMRTVSEKEKKIQLKEYQTYERRLTEYTESIKLFTDKYFVFAAEYIIDGGAYILSAQRCELINGLYMFSHTFERKYKREGCRASHSALICEGYVKDNNDPDGLGRIRIDFSQSVGVTEFVIGSLPWIRYITPYAADSGIYTIPDKGEKVLAVFSGDSFIALGSVREKKVIDGLEPKMRNFGIDAENCIRISEDKLIISAASLEISADKLNIKGSDSVNIGDNDINISGNKIKLG